MAITYNRKWFSLSESETKALETHRFTHILRASQHPEWVLVMDDYKPDPSVTYEEELQDRRDEKTGELQVFVCSDNAEIMFSRDAGKTYAPVILYVKYRRMRVHETTVDEFEYLLPGEVDPLPADDPAEPRSGLISLNRVEMLGDVFLPVPYEEFPPQIEYRLYKRAPQPFKNAPVIRRVCKYAWGEGCRRYLTIVLGKKIYGGNVMIITNAGSNGSKVVAVEHINNDNQCRDCTIRYSTKEGTSFFQRMGEPPHINFVGDVKIIAVCMEPTDFFLGLKDVARFADGQFVLDEGKLRVPMSAAIPFCAAGLFGRPSNPEF